jgi:hypothetical protein
MGVFMFSTVVMAQETAAAVPQDVSMIDFITLLIQSLNGLKGAGALAAAGVLVQLVLAFAKTPLAGLFFQKLPSGMKLVAVTGLSVVAGVVALLVSGVTLGAALVHSSTLAAFTVFAHQVYKHFFQKKLEAPKEVDVNGNVVPPDANGN